MGAVRQILGAMRVFLQNVETLHYFYGGERWGPYAEQALDFGKGERAAQFSTTRRLREVRIVFKFEPHENRANFHVLLKIDQPRPDQPGRM